MAAPVTAQLADLTERAILTIIFERLTTMNTDLSALQANFSALQGQVAQLKTIADAGLALSTRAVAVLEDLAAQVAGLAPTQAAIDALAASVLAETSKLSDDNAELTASSAALQTELDKVSPPVPVP